jgi:hypothetical protein
LPGIDFDFSTLVTHATLHGMIVRHHAANQLWGIVSYLLSQKCNNVTRRCLLNGTKIPWSWQSYAVLIPVRFHGLLDPSAIDVGGLWRLRPPDHPHPMPREAALVIHFA